MSNFLKKLTSLFPKKETKPTKIKVCWDFLSEMLGPFLLLTKDEEDELNKLDDQDPNVLRAIIQEYVVPHYRYFPPENQEKIKNTLTYYLATNSEKLAWVFPSHYVPFLDDQLAKLFYTLVWQELYGTDFPEQINPDDYVEDCSIPFINSLLYSSLLEKKHNPDGKEPSIDNIKARLEKQS